MPKLTYWIADHLDDVAVYSIRAKTRKECEAERIKDGSDRYGAPRKVTIQYANALDLVRRVLSEGGAEGIPLYRDEEE